MPRSLRDIPGSNRPRKRFASSRERDLWAPRRAFNLDLTPRALRLERPQRAMRPRREFDVGIILIGAATIGLVVWMGTSFWSATRVRVDLAGLVDGTPFQPEAAKDLDITITVPSEDDRFRATVSFDGIDVLEDLSFTGDTLRLRPDQLVESGLLEGALDEGEHKITLSVGRLFLSDSVFQWRYAVDSLPPSLKVPPALDPVPIDIPVTVRGEVEPDAELRLAGKAIEATDGRFEVTFDRPPTGALRFEAVDRAGNRSVTESVVPVVYPTSSRGVHVSAAVWSDEVRRAAVLNLIDAGLIDTVELDLKNESGAIGYESKVPMARRIGAVKGTFDLAAAVKTLKGHHVRVIGRIVTFRDPTYASAAWTAGRKDEVLQTPSGEMLSTGGGYSNYVHPAVRRYNLDIALEAISLGVQDILWDYVRRPEGAPDTMVVPGLGGPSSDEVADFLAEAHDVLRAKGVYQGATVLGIAAASGDAIAQDVPAMARVVDYLAPMIYPSQWGPGEYRVGTPIREPFEISKRALADFQRVTKGSGVRFLPWIQDFTVRDVPYGQAEVRAQIDAAASLGVSGFLLWNPDGEYTTSALTPIG